MAEQELRGHGGAVSSGGHGGTGSSGSQGDDRRSQGGPDEDRRDLEHAVPGGTQVAPYKWWAEGEQREQERSLG